MRIILFSNAPFCQTSYGRITRELALRFRDLGHDIAIAANYGLAGNAIDWNGITIYPAVRHRLGFDTIGDYCRHFYTDVVLTLYDVWAFPADIGRVIEPAWIAYTPIDGAPVPPSVVDRLTAQRGDPVYTVSMSKFGERELDKAGVPNTYIPLGIDCDVFKPGDKETARTALSIPQDVFMATMVAANKGLPPRKSWIAAFTAFAHFNKSQPNSVLYAHTTKTPMVKDGIFLDRLADELGIKERVVFPDECELAVGVPDEQMATIYQASDVLLSPSQGEGFGLPIVEAQACFKNGTLVLTDSGYTPIEAINSGDIVLAHDGTRRKVLRAMSRAYTGHMVSVRVQGDSIPVVCTDYHPWLVRKDNSLSFVEAVRLKPGDVLCLPREKLINKAHTLDLDQYAKAHSNQSGRVGDISPSTTMIGTISVDGAVARLLGFYVSEGSLTSKSDVRFSFHAEEEAFQRDVSATLNELGLNVRNQQQDNSTTVCTSSVLLARLLKYEFGKGAHNKRIPGWVHNLPAGIAAEFLYGVWMGDGCFYVDRDIYVKASYSTVSKQLAYDLRHLLLRFGVCAAISTNNHGTAYQIRLSGRGASILAEVLGVLVYDGRTSRRDILSVSKDYGFAKVSDIRVYPVKGEMVYNLSVEDTPSYVVQGYAVHNCGCPVITQNCSAMRELTIYGQCIEPLQPVWITQLDYYWQQASVERINFALRAEYNTAHSVEWSQSAIEKIRDRYHWPSVIDRYWKPFLEQVGGELW